MSVQSRDEMLFLHLENRRDIFYLPLKRSVRIKYTSFAVSKNYIIFGASSGGLYTFKKQPCSFWQLIPSKENAVTIVSISSSENFVAFSTAKNVICIVELNENSNGKLVTRIDDLCDSEITALCWINDNTKSTLFIGDSRGRVSLLKLSFLNKNILHVPTSVFMTFDSSVVQLSCEDDFLLASTMTRCYLCDTAKEQFKQIGQQLRDGYYGATFLKDEKKIFCARPGYRLWEVDCDGLVHSTHQFKQKLKVRPTSYVTIFDDAKIVDVDDGKIANDYSTTLTDNVEGESLPYVTVSPSVQSTYSVTSNNFTKVYHLLGRYIVTYSTKAIYVLNIDTVDVLFWNNRFGRIVDVQCLENTIYLWNADGYLHELSLLTIEKCLLTLYFKKHYHLCADLIYHFFEKMLLSRTSLTQLLPLRDLQWSRMNATGSVVADGDDTGYSIDKIRILSAFEEHLKSLPVREEVVKLKSGVHVVVNNKYLSRRLLDDNLVNKVVTGDLSNCTINENADNRNRSHSLPSDYRRPCTRRQDLIFATQKLDLNGQSSTNRTLNSPEILEQVTSPSPSPSALTSSSPLMNSQIYNQLFLELGVYNSPFITMASYNILQDNFTELGVNVSEKLNITSKNLVEKWRTFENTIKRYGGMDFGFESTVVSGNEDVRIDREKETTVTPFYDGNNRRFSEEPIVNLTSERKNKILNGRAPIEVDFSEIMAAVSAIEAHDDVECNEKEKFELVFELLNTVLRQYNDLARKHEFGVYQTLLFSANEKCELRLKNVLNAYLDKEFLLKWFRRDENVFLATSSVFSKHYPPLILETFDEDELKLDYFTSQVLIIFSPLLNPMTIFETMKSFQLPCCYLSLCFVLKYFQNGQLLERTSLNENSDADSSEVDGSNNEKGIRWPMPVYLNTMLLMVSVDQVDVFCEMGLKKHVDVGDVAYMMLYLEYAETKCAANNGDDDYGNVSNVKNEERHSESKYRDTWLLYIEKLWERNYNGNNVDLIFGLRNVNVLRLTMKMFATLNDKLYEEGEGESCCASCWFSLPLPQSHAISINRMKYVSVGRALLTQFWHIFQTVLEYGGNNIRDNHHPNTALSTDDNGGSGCDCEHSLYSYKNLLQLRRTINDSTEYRSFTYACYKNMEACKHLICQTLRKERNVDFNATNITLLLSLNIICSLCRRIALLWAYIPSLQKNKGQVKLLHPRHLIQLGDVAELESEFQQITVNDARIILQWKSSLSDGNCLNCANRIPLRYESEKLWTDLTLLILRHLAAKQTLKILEEFSTLMKLKKSFYRSSILTSVPGINTNLTEHVMSAISNHCEMNSTSLNILDELKTTLKRDKPNKGFSTKNSDAHHWGITVCAEEGNQAICYCCSLPLFSKSLMKECNGGVFVFSCSHTYHTICLKNRNCTATCLVCDRFLR